MDKQNVIYLCARISFNHKEGMKHWHTLHYEWTLNTRRRVKEADHERAQIVWFCLYWNIQNRRIHGDKQIDGCQGLGILRKMGSNFSRIWSFSGEERCHVIKLTVIMDHQGEYTKSHWIEHIWWMNCMICELYLNKLLPKKKKKNKEWTSKGIKYTTRPDEGRWSWQTYPLALSSPVIHSTCWSSLRGKYKSAL